MTLTISNVPLFAQWLAYCQKHFDAMPGDIVAEFACSQFDIVEQALHFDRGLRACTSRAADITCVFVAERVGQQDEE